MEMGKLTKMALTLTLILGVLTFVAFGPPILGIASLLLLFGGLVLELLNLKFPFCGSLSFGLLVYAPAIFLTNPSTALLIAALVVLGRESAGFTTKERLSLEISLELLPLSVASLSTLLPAPVKPWLSWCAAVLCWEYSRRALLYFLLPRFSSQGRKVVRSLELSTRELRWGLIGMAVLAIFIAESIPEASFLFLPILISFRRSAIHVYAYLDQREKDKLSTLAGLLSQDLESARSKIRSLHSQLITTSNQRDMLSLLSTRTTRAQSLKDFITILAKSVRKLDLGNDVQLFLREEQGWLGLRCDERQPVQANLGEQEVGSMVSLCWREKKTTHHGSWLYLPMSGVGVLALSRTESTDEFEALTSILASQVGPACLSVKRYETVQHGLKQLSESNQALTEAIAELHQTRTRAVQNEKLAAIGQLSAGIAHEINNPLSSVRLTLEAIQRVEALAPFHRELLDNALRGLDRTKRIIESLLSYSRAGDRGCVDLSLARVAEDTMDFIGASFRMEKIKLRLDPPGSDYVVQANPQDVQQIITNLLLNAKSAVKGTESPEIVLKVLEADHPGLEVHDCGPGVPPEKREVIFEPFSTTKPAGEGTGIGLSLSLTLAHRNDAKLRCDQSELLGGARFSLSFELSRQGVSPSHTT